MSAVLIVSDIDGTMMGPGEKINGVCDSVDRLHRLGYYLTLATAKSIYEIMGLLDKICLKESFLAAIVESGGAIYASPGVLLDPSMEVNVMGSKLEVLELGARLSDYEDEIDEIIVNAGCEDMADRLSRIDPYKASKYTRLPLPSAKLATMREYMDVVWTYRRECIDSIASLAEKRGFYVFTTRRSIHIGLHGGKHVALRSLLDQISYRGIEEVIGIGDTNADKEMLELVDKAIVIPQSNGELAVDLQRSDYTVAPYSAPTGWVYSVNLITLKLI